MLNECLGALMFTGGFLFLIVILILFLRIKDKTYLVEVWNKRDVIYWVIAFFIVASFASLFSIFFLNAGIWSFLIIMFAAMILALLIKKISIKCLPYEWVICFSPFNLGFVFLMLYLQLKKRT